MEDGSAAVVIRTSEADRRAAFANLAQSGVRPRASLDRAIRVERRIAVHFLVRKKKKKGEIGKRVFPAGMVECIQHATGCVEYLDLTPSPRVKRRLIDAAQASAWEWAWKNTGLVAVVVTMRVEGGQLVIAGVDQPQSNPSYGILRDLPPRVHVWMLEVACHATTSRGILEHCLHDLLPAEQPSNLEEVSPRIVVHSFHAETCIGRILIQASNASACQRLASLVWGRLLPLVARSQ